MVVVNNNNRNCFKRKNVGKYAAQYTKITIKIENTQKLSQSIEKVKK